MSDLSHNEHSLRLPFPPTTEKGLKWLNRIRGFLHRWVLCEFSVRYCQWLGIVREGGIFPLPFNMILKWTDGTREEEAIAMMSAGAIGLPVPRMLSFGDHGPRTNGSILMTRIPGQLLNDLIHDMSESERDTISAELDLLIRRMRMYENPFGARVCTVDGSGIRSHRVPGLLAGPSANITAFYDELISTAHPLMWKGREDRYGLHMAIHRRIYSMSHRLVFTHGDLRDHNIMVENGHITGIIDWECAGWLPEYWEFTTVVRPILSDEVPWHRLVQSLPSNTYKTEYESEFSLWLLTQDSWGH